MCTGCCDYVPRDVMVCRLSPICVNVMCHPLSYIYMLACETVLEPESAADPALYRHFSFQLFTPRRLSVQAEVHRCRSSPPPPDEHAPISSTCRGHRCLPSPWSWVSSFLSAVTGVFFPALGDSLPPPPGKRLYTV